MALTKNFTGLQNILARHPIMAMVGLIGAQIAINGIQHSLPYTSENMIPKYMLAAGQCSWHRLKLVSIRAKSGDPFYNRKDSMSFPKMKNILNKKDGWLMIQNENVISSKLTITQLFPRFIWNDRHIARSHDAPWRADGNARCDVHRRPGLRSDACRNDCSFRKVPPNVRAAYDGIRCCVCC